MLSNKITGSNWLWIYIFVTFLLPLTSSIAADYTLETIAQTSGPSLGGHSYLALDGRLSINNNGAVAFAGVELSDNTSRLYKTSDTGLPVIPPAIPPALTTTSIPTTSTGSTRQFGGAAISNEAPVPYIISRELISGAPPLTIIREWVEGNGELTFSTRRSTAGIIGSSFFGDFPAATSLVDINDDGVVAFVGTAGPQESPAIYRTDVGLLFPTIFPTGSVLRPQLANNGDLVVTGPSSQGKRILILDNTGTPKKVVASLNSLNGSPGLSTIGDFPGISPDGNYVGFTGNKPDGTQGIYIYAMLPAPLLPRYIAVEEVKAGNNPDGFTDLSPSLNNRIGVISSGGFSKIATDSDYGGDYRTSLVTVVFTAKRNNQLGIYTVDLLFMDGNFYAKSTPRLVAEVGTTGPPLDPSLPDMSMVTSFTLYDPISYNKDTRDIYIAFRAQFAGGASAIYRAKRNCQIPNMTGFDYKQVDPAWKNEPLGYNTVDDTEFTIGKKGCAMTSVTNILNYHEVKTLASLDHQYITHDFTKNPIAVESKQLFGGESFTLFISNSLFKGTVINNNSDVNFSLVPQFATDRGSNLYPPSKTLINWPQVPFQEADSNPLLNTGGNIHLDRIVDFYVCNGQPVILKVHNQGADINNVHYVVATGRGIHLSPLNNKLETTYEINDPANVNIPITNLFGISSSNRNYNGHYRGIRAFSTKGFHENISISAHSPVELLVTDPLGRRIGYDANTAQRYNEIYNSSYSHDAISDLDGTVGGDTYKTISIGSAKEDDGLIIGVGRGVVMGGDYSVKAIGTNTGKYRLVISSTDEMANTQKTVISGEIIFGHVEGFNVYFGPNLGSLPLVTAQNGVSLVNVPPLINLAEAGAISGIISSGFSLGTVTKQASYNVAEGRVISQYPYAGDHAFPGIAINLVVSSGSLISNAIVPNIVNFTQTNAVSVLMNAGLTANVTPAFSSTVPAGTVISQNPASGTQVASGSSVDVVVSSGPELITVPNVVGLTQANAVFALTTAGLTVNVTTASSSTVPAGIVISQNPTSNAKVSSGSGVGVVVSSGSIVSCANNLSAKVSITQGGFRINRTTNRYVQQINIKNVSSEDIPGPVALVMDQLSSNATLFNANGTTSCNTPANSYMNVNVGIDNVLSVGESVAITLEFKNPTNKAITYSTKLLSGAPL